MSTDSELPSEVKFKNGGKIVTATQKGAKSNVESPLPKNVVTDYFKNLPAQTVPGYVRNRDRNVKCFCGSNRKVKYCCAWKTVANFVIARGYTWYKKVNDGAGGNRQIDLAGMPVRSV